MDAQNTKGTIQRGVRNQVVHFAGFFYHTSRHVQRAAKTDNECFPIKDAEVTDLAR